MSVELDGHEAAVDAVAYLRVSTAEQAAHGTGLRTQADAIAHWAHRSGRRIIGWHTDQGRSGALAIEDRIALADAIDQATVERCELVIYRLDRFARDLVIQEDGIAELGRRGVRLRVTDDAEDRLVEDPAADTADGHTRTFIRQVLGAVGQLERSLIRMRTNAGRKKAELEGYYCGGYPPYGWVAPPKKKRGERTRWLPDPGPRWHVAGWIVERRLEGYGWARIAQYLTDQGITPPSGNGNPWSDNAVKVVVRGVERMAGRGYATPGPRLPEWGQPSWGFRDGSASTSTTPAAL